MHLVWTLMLGGLAFPVPERFILDVGSMFKFIP